MTPEKFIRFRRKCKEEISRLEDDIESCRDDIPDDYMPDMDLLRKATPEDLCPGKIIYVKCTCEPYNKKNPNIFWLEVGENTGDGYFRDYRGGNYCLHNCGHYFVTR
jgi:hypothetical protein